MVYDVVIIGAGASGLMLASQLQDKKVCLIDNNKKIAPKIKVSGGGKCNITNKFCNENYYLGEKEFVKNILEQFTQNDLKKFLSSHNFNINFDEKIVKGTYFCDRSEDLINLFRKLTTFCTFKLTQNVLDVTYESDIYKIQTNSQIINAKKLVIASGGLSYATLGATSIGFDIAKKFGHSIKKTSPALVGFTVQKDQFWFKELSGLSLGVKIKVKDKELEGQMLFTHKGCSGPVILTTSLYWEKGNFSIDFSPYKDSYLPKRFKKAIKDIDNFDINNYTMSPAGNFGYTKAEVTKGGVNTSEVTNTCQSRLQKDLYFIGEVLDVTGELGGYNFQWAFSSAIACAKELKCV